MAKKAKNLADLNFNQLLDWHIDRIIVMGSRTVVWVGEKKIEYNHRRGTRGDFDRQVKAAVQALFESLHQPVKRFRDDQFVNVSRHRRSCVPSVAC